MSGAFLQTSGAQLLRKIVLKDQDVPDLDRQDLLSFLSGGQGEGYAPQAGQITGLLKGMKDTMAAGLAKATEEENTAIKNFSELMAAKNKEVNALTAAIETKTVRSGELAVEIVQMKNDLGERGAIVKCIGP